MADYFEALRPAPFGARMSALLSLHENPQGSSDQWRREADRERADRPPNWAKLERDGFIRQRTVVNRRLDIAKVKVVYMLADENITWLLMDIVNLVLRRLGRERAEARAILRYAAAGPDRGEFDAIFIESPDLYKTPKRPRKKRGT